MNAPIPAASAPRWRHERDKGNDGWLESEWCHRQPLRALPVTGHPGDTDGRVTFYNHAAASLWEREPELNQDPGCGSWKIFEADGARNRVLPPPEPIRNSSSAVVGAVNTWVDLTHQAGSPGEAVTVGVVRPGGSRRRLNSQRVMALMVVRSIVASGDAKGRKAIPPEFGLP